MGFFDYFKNKLRYPQISGPGVAAFFADGIAKILDSKQALAERVRDQFIPPLALDDFIELYGKSRGIIQHPLEPDTQYKKRVLNAFVWQKQAGRFRGMHNIFKDYGYPLINLHELSNDKWAEFELDINTPETLSADTWELLIWIANEYKRASARLSTIRTRKEARGILIIRTKLSTREEWRVFPPECVLPKPQGTLRVAAAAFSCERWRVGKG